jgi:hypothetical protein
VVLCPPGSTRHRPYALLVLMTHYLESLMAQTQPREGDVGILCLSFLFSLTRISAASHSVINVDAHHWLVHCCNKNNTIIKLCLKVFVKCWGCCRIKDNGRHDTVDLHLKLFFLKKLSVKRSTRAYLVEFYEDAK